jgi:hypothetical protein
VLGSGEPPEVLPGVAGVLDPVVPADLLAGVGRLTPCSSRQLRYAANFSAAALFDPKPFAGNLGRRLAQAVSAFLKAGLLLRL